MGCCFSKPTDDNCVDTDGHNAVHMDTARPGAAPTHQECCSAAASLRAAREARDLEAWQEWWQAVLTARSSAAQAYTLRERLDGNWDCHVAKTRCSMGVPGCTCYKGIDFAPFFNDRVTLGSRYRCYGVIEREVAAAIGPAPIRRC